MTQPSEQTFNRDPLGQFATQDLAGPATELLDDVAPQASLPLADAVRRDDPELAAAEKRNTLILATMSGTVASGQVSQREPLSDPVAEEYVSGWEKEYRRAARPRLLDRLVGGEARAARREARLQDALGEYHGIKETVTRIQGAFDHEIRRREAQERGLSD